MNKKKAKVLVIGKYLLIQVMQLPESPLLFSLMPKRTISLLATTTWYPSLHLDSRGLNLFKNNPHQR